jgi:hypothetical protein
MAGLNGMFAALIRPLCVLCVVAGGETTGVVRGGRAQSNAELRAVVACGFLRRPAAPDAD